MSADAIHWSKENGAELVPQVIARGDSHGWTHYKTQPHQGQLVILRKDYPNGGVKKMQLNIWCTTGTVGSYLWHPKQGKTQLFRREISTWTELDAILQNPRVHTDKGFKTKKNKAAKEEAAAKAVPGRATYTERGDADPGGSSPPAKPKRRAPPTTKPAAPVFDAAPGAKQRGVVKFYDARVRFFGFITADVDGSDIYVRRNSIKKGHKLYPGTKVEFEVEKTSKAPQAKKVKVLS